MGTPRLPTCQLLFPQRGSLKESAVSCPGQIDDSFSVGLGLQRPRPGLREFARKAGLAFLDESSLLQMEPEQQAGKAKLHLVSQVRDPAGSSRTSPQTATALHTPQSAAENGYCVSRCLLQSQPQGAGPQNACRRQPGDRLSGLPPTVGSLYVFPGNKQLTQTKKKCILS